MPKINISIEDNLQDWVNDAIEQVQKELENYIAQNKDLEETPCLNNDLDYSGAIHEIIDGAIPIYTDDINNAFYLHGDEIEQAFDDAGIGEKNDKGWPMGWRVAAIYCYIQEKVNEWYQENASDIFDDCKK